MAISKNDILKACNEWDAPGGVDDTVWDRFIFQQRWPNGVKCPFCGYGRYYNLKGSYNNFKCANHKCYRKFSLISGTVLENIKMDKHLFFIFVVEVLTEKDGNVIVRKRDGTIQPKEDYVFSPSAIKYDFNLTYKTAWHVLKKIRANCKGGLFYLTPISYERIKD